ncbi:IS110 family transposase [Pseudomonas knackmussii]|uniref:IS110 family transposase n=1 Tax=Pseudomonas knackmussii TaxID=65741 RepID=A0ABY4KT55_9PSED|nr:IS110 family transposase [Pseudomonas knackmussii]UPQ82888.1 IS110 family transposase [Pseudomonas knackmussii]
MSTSDFLPLGIDISKKKIDCALMLGAKFKNKVFANTPDGLAGLCAWNDRARSHRPAARRSQQAKPSAHSPE